MAYQSPRALVDELSEEEREEVQERADQIQVQMASLHRQLSMFGTRAWTDLVDMIEDVATHLEVRLRDYRESDIGVVQYIRGQLDAYAFLTELPEIAKKRRQQHEEELRDLGESLDN